MRAMKIIEREVTRVRLGFNERQKRDKKKETYRTREKNGNVLDAPVQFYAKLLLHLFKRCCHRQSIHDANYVTILSIHFDMRIISLSLVFSCSPNINLLIVVQWKDTANFHQFAFFSLGKPTYSRLFSTIIFIAPRFMSLPDFVCFMNLTENIQYCD